MQETKTYRQYATECLRMSQKLNAKDRDVLLQMAVAWELRAQEAERQQENGKEK